MPYRLATWLTPRRVSIALYAAYALAGLTFIFYPSQAVQEKTTPFMILLFHSFLIMGGGISTYGAICKKVMIEIAGIPLVSASLIAYGLILFSAFADSGAPDQVARIGVGFLMMGGLFGLIGRLAEIVKIMAIERRLDHNDEQRKGA